MGRNRIPKSVVDGGTTYFVDHHDGKEVTDGGEEQAVEVMLDLVADVGGKDVENDLSGHEEEDAKANVAQWPAILQRVDDEEDLHDEVDPDADGIDDVQDDKEADGVGGPQAGPALEGHERDGKRDDKHGERA